VKRTLLLRRESLHELAGTELSSVRGGTTPWVTDGHHCFGSTLCGVTLADTCLLSVCACPPPNSLVGCA
jgi:hypothetical protein